MLHKYSFRLDGGPANLTEGAKEAFFIELVGNFLPWYLRECGHKKFSVYLDGIAITDEPISEEVLKQLKDRFALTTEAPDKEEYRFC